MAITHQGKIEHEHCPYCDNGIRETRRSMGRRMLELRIASGLSLRGLAEKSGLSATYVHDVERGRRRASKGAWDALMKALGEG